MWAFAALLFYLPLQPEFVLFIGCMYAGLVSGATVSTSAHMPAFHAFTIPTILPFAIRNLIEGGTVYLPMGVTIIIYLVVSIIFARNINRSMAELNRLQFRNMELMERLETEKRVAEEQRGIAETAVREKSRFLAAASHDLRQPLHASGLLLGALGNHVSSHEGRRILEKISDSNRILNQLFNSLLDVSRLDAGVVEVHPRHIATAEILNSLESEFRMQAQEKGLSFEVRHSDEVVRADPVLLSRILRNLIKNAITYTKAGSVCVKSRANGKGWVEIEVVDTGPGIPDWEAENIFSEYYQIDNPERDRSKGLGLGLAIVKRLCLLMDIAIDLQSRPGERTRFVLEVEAGDPKRVRTESTTRILRSLAGMRVLVIDDDRSVLEGVDRLLSGWGCKVMLAESEEEAVGKLAEGERVPDVILADYRLREGRTGVDAIHRVLDELNRDIPAALITGDTSPDRLRSATSAGFRLLHKPVTPDELHVLLQEVAGITPRG
ncbi:MAG: response regulator [Caldilineae bacterium]|nr:MAG: response regulator [Caldilineae bacterium]